MELQPESQLSLATLFFNFRQPNLKNKKTPGRRSAQPHGSTHALTGVHLKSTDNRPDDHCWWCDHEKYSGAQQTRDHLFKHCSMWKDQQAELWAMAKEATRGAKRKLRVGDLLSTLRRRCNHRRNCGVVRYQPLLRSYNPASSPCCCAQPLRTYQNLASGLSTAVHLVLGCPRTATSSHVESTGRAHAALSPKMAISRSSRPWEM